MLQNSGNKYKAIPLPGDRDNAFFKLEGVIPTIISNKNVEPLVRPFEEEIDYLPGLVYPMDVYFLKGTPEEVYISEAKILQEKLSNTNIIAALKTLPKELYKLNGEEIVEKIKQRREDLVDYAISFRSIIEERDFLSKPLKGSEDLELNPNLLKCFECDISGSN
ncbi:hypothetical protein LZ575_21940 [Antarcticibacterium sp. 1MA-6-2]|uniref:hypothetical protein n=1 Tax=Antarcticibacterium sp. 1MA-6-2 TaxID=2908210 RepID=UPI001F3EAC69|nr:hypothetical protein [Antarcticibacterium sp. 1MA-6-2]UJH91220.1 hypothetical protein LZ575_21940 [Antarcticibacterium sp. 1MA-6-2]